MRVCNQRATLSFRNKTYKRNHHNSILALFTLVCKGYGHITWKALAELAGITQKTLYLHFKSINNLFQQSVEVILNDFRLTLKRGHNLYRMIPGENQRVFYILYVFLSRQKDIFDLICNDYDHQALLYYMVQALLPYLKIQWLPNGNPTPDMSSERVHMLVCMLVGVTSEWGRKTHCDIKQADRYINRMVKIVEIAEENKLP